MRYHSGTILLVLAILVALVLPVTSEARPALGIGFGGGYLMPQLDNYNTSLTIGPSTVPAQNGLASFAFDLTYHFDRHFMMALSYFYASHERTGVIPETDSLFGVNIIENIPLSGFSLQVLGTITPNRWIDLYGGLGLGLYTAQLQYDWSFYSDDPRYDPTESGYWERTSTDFGGEGVAGIEVFPTENLAITFGAKYFLSSSMHVQKPWDNRMVDIDRQGLLLMAQIRVYLGVSGSQ